MLLSPDPQTSCLFCLHSLPLYSVLYTTPDPGAKANISECYRSCLLPCFIVSCECVRTCIWFCAHLHYVSWATQYSLIL